VTKRTTPAAPSNPQGRREQWRTPLPHSRAPHASLGYILTETEIHSVIQTLAVKSKIAASGIQALVNLYEGLRPLTTASNSACVGSVLCYGAEAWWPGRHRTSQSITGEQKLVSNGVAAQLGRLDQVFRGALLETIPVYRTTQAAALHREAAIPPMELLLDQRRRALSVRVHQLDYQHPLQC